MATDGTREWADSNVNIQKGCKNNCRYCYAKWMAIRFKRIKMPHEWEEVEVLNDKIEKGYRKRKGRVMFPTSHDIYEENLEECIKVLQKLLSAGNEVLITTKPRLKCIYEIMRLLEQYKSLIQFRFTITSMHSWQLKRWEPNAPNLSQRLSSLSKAYRGGFKTSVSIEPYLDMDPVPLIQMVAPLCTESVWLGIMNDTFMHYYDMPQGFEDRYKLDNLIEIVYQIYNLPVDMIEKIRFKDSVVNLLESRGLGDIITKAKKEVIV